MLCPSCSKEIPDGSVFCNLCGKSTQPQPAQSNAKTWLIFLAGLVTACIIGGALYLALRPDAKKAAAAPQKPAVAQTAPIVQQPVPVAHSKTVLDTAFTVNSGNWSAYKFEVPAGAKNAKLDGHFAAKGGMNNSIEVFVTNEDGMANLKNRNQYKRFYFSGRVTQNSINVPLPPTPDTYYLVFDNRFALMIPRAVEANATLTYVTVGDQ